MGKPVPCHKSRARQSHKLPGYPQDQWKLAVWNMQAQLNAVQEVVLKEPLSGQHRKETLEIMLAVHRRDCLGYIKRQLALWIETHQPITSSNSTVINPTRKKKYA